MSTHPKKASQTQFFSAGTKPKSTEDKMGAPPLKATGTDKATPALAETKPQKAKSKEAPYTVQELLTVSLSALKNHPAEKILENIKPALRKLRWEEKQISHKESGKTDIRKAQAKIDLLNRICALQGRLGRNKGKSNNKNESESNAAIRVRIRALTADIEAVKPNAKIDIGFSVVFSAKAKPDSDSAQNDNSAPESPRFTS